MDFKRTRIQDGLMESFVASAIAYMLASWGLHWHLSKQGYEKGIARSSLAMMGAMIVATLVGAGVDWMMPNPAPSAANSADGGLGAVMAPGVDMQKLPEQIKAVEAALRAMN